MDLDVPEYQLSPETGTSCTDRGCGRNLPTRPLAEGLADYRFHLLGQDATKGKHREPGESFIRAFGEKPSASGTTRGDTRQQRVERRQPDDFDN